MKLIKLIIDHLFGKKYYANIIWTKGTEEMQISSFIHKSKKEAENHRKQIESTYSFEYVETVSFRSKRNY